MNQPNAMFFDLSTMTRDEADILVALCMFAALNGEAAQWFPV